MATVLEAERDVVGTIAWYQGVATQPHASCARILYSCFNCPVQRIEDGNARWLTEFQNASLSPSS